MPGAAALLSGVGLALGLPHRPDMPWDRSMRVELGPDLAWRKRRCVRCFTTQLTGPSPVLPAAVVERLTRSFEVLVRP